MPIFKCSKCGMMENTAPALYWTRKEDEPPLCTLCDPKIGKWHGMFKREPVPPDYVEGPDGFVYHPKDPYLKQLLKRKK